MTFRYSVLNIFSIMTDVKTFFMFKNVSLGVSIHCLTAYEPLSTIQRWNLLQAKSCLAFGWKTNYTLQEIYNLVASYTFDMYIF